MKERWIVCGAPCSGKTSFVRDSAGPGDLVWDYDSVHSALSGLGHHQHLKIIRPFVLAARAAVFSLLESEVEINAWVITSSRRFEEIEEMGKRFGAGIVFLDIEKEEAHRRADEDGRPVEWHQYIENWFEESDVGINIERNQEMEKGKKVYKSTIVLDPESDQGDFSAEFATLDVLDHDNDITVSGAFIDGQEVVVEAWNHNYSSLPVGKGFIRESDGKAVFEGAFFLETTAGLEHYKTVKAMGSLQEWSYTFSIIESHRGEKDGESVQYLTGLDVWGVAPVQRGAGIETRTVEIKRKTEPETIVEGSVEDQDEESDSEVIEDDKPSGVGPGVILAQIELIELEVN